MSLDQHNMDQLRARLLAWPGLRPLQPSDREDLVQDVVRILLESGDRTSKMNQRELMQYAQGILRNRRAMFFRRRVLEQRPDTKQRLAQAARAKSPPMPIETLTENERVGRINDAISLLGDLDRQILRLRQQGMAFEEIATKLGKTSAAIRQRYVRALHRIRDEYFGKC